MPTGPDVESERMTHIRPTLNAFFRFSNPEKTLLLPFHVETICTNVYEFQGNYQVFEETKTHDLEKRIFGCITKEIPSPVSTKLA